MATTEGWNMWGLWAKSATCDSHGTVTAMSGNWWRDYNPLCATCSIYGTFDAVRI